PGETITARAAEETGSVTSTRNRRGSADSDGATRISAVAVGASAVRVISPLPVMPTGVGSPSCQGALTRHGRVTLSPGASSGVCTVNTIVSSLSAAVIVSSDTSTSTGSSSTMTASASAVPSVEATGFAIVTPNDSSGSSTVSPFTPTRIVAEVSPGGNTSVSAPGT